METNLGHDESGGVVTTPNQGHLKIRYKFKNNEFEGEGPADEVNRHAMAFLTTMATRKKTPSANSYTHHQQMGLFEETDKPLLGDNGLSENLIVDGEQNHSTETLLTFYLRTAWDAKEGISTASQANQLLLITYYLTQIQGISQLHLDDYRKAYSELSELPVKTPANISARLGELVKTDILRKVNDTYSFTYKGLQLTEKMISGS